MKATRAAIIVSLCLLLIGLTAHPQTPDETKHFEKDGLSFDYPSSWQVSDQSTKQMQFLELQRGDGYALRRRLTSISSPRPKSRATMRCTI